MFDNRRFEKWDIDILESLPIRNPCSDPKFNDTRAFGARDVDATAANKTKTAKEEKKKSSFLLKITRLEFALLPLHSSLTAPGMFSFWLTPRSIQIPTYPTPAYLPGHGIRRQHRLADIAGPRPDPDTI